MGTLSREEEIRWHRNDVRRNLRERHRAKLQQTNWAMRKFREEKDPDEAGESWKYDRVPLRELSTGEDGDHPSPFYPGIPSEAWLRSIVGESCTFLISGSSSLIAFVTLCFASKMGKPREQPEPL